MGDKMLKWIKELAYEAGKIILDGYNQKSSTIEHKGKVDLVTETDLKCERFLTKSILRKFPEDSILAEEETQIVGSSNRRWIIDPLDGTTNFSHRYPFFAVSIALEIAGEISFGVVYNPVYAEMFSASKSNGAYLNDNLIEVSKCNELSNSLIATGFPYDRWENGTLYIAEMKKFMDVCQGVRREGSAAIDLCFVACGRIDGYFERKLKPWDMAAGALIATEAGAIVSTYSGKNWDCFEDTILVSNLKLAPLIIKILNN